MIENVTDRIEKEVAIHASRARVWQALTDSREFGQWFQVDIKDAFVEGKPARGTLTVPGYERLSFEIHVERMDPPRLFSFSWHPYAVDPKQDYSQEPTTLVEFELTETPQGTRLRVSESGFDRIPAGRRHEAFRMNSDGWTEQMQNIATYVGPTA